jgi:hypothetical protein
LPRTGIQYVDLVEMLKTRFINPAYPQGRALTILESIRFSYRFLQNMLVDSTDRKVRFAKLIEFLNNPQTLVPEIDDLLHPDPYHQRNPEHCLPHTDFHNWVYCYFERIGKLIVLESGEGPRLSLAGELFLDPPGSQQPVAPVGILRSDGTITAPDGETILGHVGAHSTIVNGITETLAGPVTLITGKKNLLEQFGSVRLSVGVSSAVGVPPGYLFDTELIDDPERQRRAQWLPARDTCDLDKVRLTHLDGSVLTVGEYDRMQRFVRLWHKLGWTIAETDLALIGMSTSRASVSRPGGVAMLPGNGNAVGFDMFQSDCSDVGDGDDGGCVDTPEHDDDSHCPQIAKVPENISVGFLHQLVAIRKLLDLTGLPLDKLLSFWADISTAGEKSLYSRLFLTHNLLGIDKVFTSDTNGNYLMQEAKLSDHMPVVMAALKLKADDVTAVVKSPFRPLPDALTLPNVSALYRHSLLAKILHVPVTDLAEVFELFGYPFTSADDTLALLRDWGNMEDAGFTFRQLNYLIQDHDDLKRPLAPAEKTILQISKTLYDGLNAIDLAHEDVTAAKKDEATADLIRTKAGLLYEASVVERIISLLEGTSVYTTNAPPNQDLAAIPETDSLAKKLKYSNQKDAKPVPTASI